jgi:signal transduction histidine kinase
MQAEDAAGGRSLAEVAWLLHRSLEVPVVVEGVLVAAKRLLQAEIAEVSLVRGPGVDAGTGAGSSPDLGTGVALGGRTGQAAWWRARLSADGWMDAREDEALEPLAVACVAGTHAVLAPRRPRAGAEAEADFLATRGLRDAVLAPLHGDELTGVLLVGNRRGRLGRPGAFTLDDAALLEALGQEAGLALDHALLVARLQAANRRKDDFVDAVAHELRGPLGSVETALATVAQRGRRLDATTRQSLLDTAGRQARRALDLLDNLLAATRLEAPPAERVPVQLGALAAEVAEVVDDLADHAGRHTVELAFGADVPTVLSDPWRLRQILGNLLANALKYAPAGSTVTLRGRRRRDGGAVVEVADEGPGIPPELHERIFERGFQAQPGGGQATGLPGGGIGLGLHLCRELARGIGPRRLGVRRAPAVRLPARPTSPPGLGAQARQARGAGAATGAGPPAATPSQAQEQVAL